MRGYRAFDADRPDHTQCPHDAVDARRCLFHHGRKEYPIDRFTDQFLHTLDETGIAPVFAGGRLLGFELQDRTITTPSGVPLDLRGAVVN